MIAGFARLQPVENRMVPALVDGAGIDWLVELAPASSPSPSLSAPRHRMLADHQGWVWPCRLPAGLLPFQDESLPALLVRHLFWLPSAADLLAECMRCLKPGGLLISVSANPWHRGSWSELGTRALHLPAWPLFLYQHGRYDLLLEVPAKDRLRGLVPGVSPVLVVAGRKPPRGAPVRRLEFRNVVRPTARAIPTSCRAA